MRAASEIPGSGIPLAVLRDTVAQFPTFTEAYLKGLGLGFNDEASIARDHDPGHWHLLDLPVRDGFAAALAIAVRTAVGARS